MNLWRSFSGVLEVELTSAELTCALAEINAMGIEIRNLKWDHELCAAFQIRRDQYRLLKALSKKRGESLRIRRYLGLFWVGRSLAARPVLVAGFLLFLLLYGYLPSRVLWIRVEGNNRVSARQILQSAEELGVSFGTNRRNLRSERIKNGILSQIPDLQWVGVNTAGCVATISVRERSVQDMTEEKIPFSRIIAARDGYILSGTVVRGTGMFREGQAVEAGQVLISGYIHSDYCIRTVRAEGEIMAQTKREMTAVTPCSHRIRISECGVKRKISLLLRKKRIKLWKDSGIYDTTYDRIYKEYYITLPGAFRLPVGLAVEEYTLWETSLTEQDRESAYTQLQRFSDRYLQQQMITGIIQTRKEEFLPQDGALRLQGEYICQEMIGREQLKEIGEVNE